MTSSTATLTCVHALSAKSFDRLLACGAISYAEWIGISRQVADEALRDPRRSKYTMSY